MLGRRSMDYARGRDMRDYARGRGSRGGRDSRDRRDMRDMGYDYNNYDSRYDYNDYGDYGDYGDYEDGEKISGYYGKTPFEMRRDYARGRDSRDYARRGRGRRDYGYDYGAEPMSPQEIREWSEDLLSQLDDREKEFFKKDKVLKRAEELGVSFDEFTLEEFYITVIMLYTDYKKDIGSASIDPYINMAKDWLKDPDSALKYGDKLTAYHDYIIMGYK